MPYVTFAERYGREIGLKEGLKEGLTKGLKEGRQEALREMLGRQLAKRFGPLTAEAHARLQAADTALLEAWADAVLDAASVEAVFAR